MSGLSSSYQSGRGLTLCFSLLFVVTTSVVIRVKKAIAFFTPHVRLKLKLPIRQGAYPLFFSPVRSNDFSRYP
ncbi:MAG: hypothetical protein ACRC8Y_26375, partial [Chroococcales cyanobacterium]